jgi:hypothetical protein
MNSLVATATVTTATKAIPIATATLLATGPALRDLRAILENGRRTFPSADFFSSVQGSGLSPAALITGVFLATLIGHFVGRLSTLSLLRCGGLTLLLPLGILR